MHIDSSQSGINARGSQLHGHSMTDLRSEDFVPPEHKYIALEQFSSAYYKDNNEEQYAIQRAFQGNNFNYLRKLPDNFSRNCVLEQRIDRVKGQLDNETSKRHQQPNQKEKQRKEKINELKKQKIGTLGYFQLFPYKQSDYEIPKKLAIEEHAENNKKREEICDLDFRPVGFDRKMKYEDPFSYIDRKDPSTAIKQPYLFPFHVSEDVYDVFHQNQIRQKLINQELKLAGDFIPSQTGYALRTITKSKLPQIINEIEFYIKKYLDNIGYFIGVNKRDHIEVVFEGKYAKNVKVQLAMSGILEHQMISKYVLRKKLDHWGTINEKTTYLEYVILPQWVKEEEKLKADN